MTADQGGTPGWRERLAALADALAEDDPVEGDKIMTAAYGERDEDHQRVVIADLRAAAAPPAVPGGGDEDEVSVRLTKVPASCPGCGRGPDGGLDRLGVEFLVARTLFPYVVDGAERERAAKAVLATLAPLLTGGAR